MTFVKYGFKKKMQKKNYWKIIVACAATILLFGCTLAKNEVNTATTGKLKAFEFIVFKIGKADSILLTAGEYHVLIDTGEDEDGEEILAYLHNHHIESIDYMILTHFDKDHIGGADTILNNIKVREVVTPNYTENSSQYEEYMAALKANHMSPTILTKDLSVVLDSSEFTILPPQENNYKKSNDYSLIVSVQHGQNSFLFTGDAEKVRLTELMEQGNLRHTFLKVPHHGKYNGKSKEFFQMVEPQYAVITCSNKNPEDARVVEALESIGVEVFLTRNGDVSVSSDGNNIKIKQ